VLVQPVFRGEGNSYVAACAQAEPEKFAAVCVVDPRVPGADRRLEHWFAQGCRGLRLRPRIAAESEIFGDPSTYPLWEAAARLEMVVSLLASPEHVLAIGNLAARFPDVPIVLDHLAHPNVENGVSGADFQALLALARYPRVFVKASGFYHFAREPFPFVDCWDLIRAVHDCFGRERMIWGSDFPHVLLNGGYAKSLLMPEDVLRWTADDRERVMGTNALSLYWPPA